jgi:hypothetical protein
MPPDLTVRTPTLDIGYVTDGVSFLEAVRKLMSNKSIS